jgi:hypothetical protein
VLLDKLKAKQVSPRTITLKQFITKYLSEHEATHNRIATVIKAEGICRNHIIPEIGHRRLQDITTQDLVLFRSNLVNYKMPSVSHNTMQIVQRVFNTAIE